MLIRTGNSLALDDYTRKQLFNMEPNAVATACTVIDGHLILKAVTELTPWSTKSFRNVRIFSPLEGLPRVFDTKDFEVIPELNEMRHRKKYTLKEDIHISIGRSARRLSKTNIDKLVWIKPEFKKTSVRKNAQVCVSLTTLKTTKKTKLHLRFAEGQKTRINSAIIIAISKSENRIYFKADSEGYKMSELKGLSNGYVSVVLSDEMVSEFEPFIGCYMALHQEEGLYWIDKSEVVR